MSSRLLRPWRPVAVAVLLLPLLAACSADSPQFPPVCPQLSLLRDAADLTRFGGPANAPHDASTLLVAAHITAVPAQCSWADPSTVRASLQLSALVQRGPAEGGAPTAAIPYFIALTEHGKVLREQDFTLTAAFRPNVDQIAVTGDRVSMLLPITKDKSAAAYHLYVGFRLSRDELAYNRANAGLQ